MHPLIINQKLKNCRDEIEFINLYLYLTKDKKWFKMERNEGFSRKGIDYLLEKGYKVAPNISAKKTEKVLIVVTPLVYEPHNRTCQDDSFLDR